MAAEWYHVSGDNLDQLIPLGDGPFAWTISSEIPLEEKLVLNLVEGILITYKDSPYKIYPLCDETKKTQAFILILLVLTS